MQRRGFPAYIIDVKRMAEELIVRRGLSTVPPKLGKNWVYRFLKRHPAIKAFLTRKRDVQRARQEDPRVIRPWFDLIQRTIAQYGIVPADTYNFDETGFAMGIISGSGARKVVGSSDHVGRIVVTQPGDREWVTSVEAANALGWMIPSFIILAGKVFLRDWFKQVLPKDIKIALSHNGWTNNALGLAWIKHFDAHTRSRVVGVYRLLILDGHDSHTTPEFDDFCIRHKIITLCMPAHASHILQPLDVGCFGPLKTAFGTLISDLARRRIFHVDKTDFLAMYVQAHAKIFTESTIKNAFKATGIHPFNPEYVLDDLMSTPSPPTTTNRDEIASSPWASNTPLTLRQLQKQVRIVDSAIQEEKDYVEPLKKISKTTSHLMTKVVLMDARIADLEDTVQHLNKKQRRSKAQLQAKEDALNVEEAQDMIERAELATQIAAEQRRKRSAPTCSLCHQSGHRRNHCSTTQVASN
jgi:hypothetical protein